ncbi:MAG TPA: hypothetical protein VFA34_07420 [Actinomycetota bacterium]|jgi:hypothetical protein|nr:hypothetical protein [Actinomycetota bacterium]
MAKSKTHTHSHAGGTQTKPKAEGEQQQEQMCCDGSGRTAEEHRKESPDGKCCVDS